MADTLGVPGQPQQDLVDVVADALASRPACLIVLDNCEHVTSACNYLVTRLFGPPGPPRAGDQPSASVRARRGHLAGPTARGRDRLAWGTVPASFSAGPWSPAVTATSAPPSPGATTCSHIPPGSCCGDWPYLPGRLTTPPSRYALAFVATQCGTTARGRAPPIGHWPRGGKWVARAAGPRRCGCWPAWPGTGATWTRRRRLPERSEALAQVDTLQTDLDAEAVRQAWGPGVKLNTDEAASLSLRLRTVPNGVRHPGPPALSVLKTCQIQQPF